MKLEKKRIILDTDPGVDDALAIAFALNSPDLKIEAITTVSGNVHVDLCTRNLLMMLEILEIENPPIIAKGESQSLIRSPVIADHVHGSDGLGEVTKLLNPDGSRRYPDPISEISEISAVDLIADLVEKYPNEISILCVGPLTNIAKAIKNHPDRLRKTKEIVLMGGAFETYGNVTTTAEFNIFADPHAAQIVFDFGVPITIVPLNLTHQIILSGDRLRSETDRRSGKWIDFLTDSTKLCMEFHNRYENFYGLYLHDPTAVGFLTNADLFETVEAFVQVETSGDLTLGMTVADLRTDRQRPEPNSQICVGVRADQFLDLFFDRIIPQRF